MKGRIFTFLLLFGFFPAEGNFLEREYHLVGTNQLQAWAEKGDKRAQHELAHRYFKGIKVNHSFETAARWFQEASEQGHVPAQYNLAWMYYEGEGVDQSFETAARWFQEAAERGFAPAQYDLAWMYYDGRGVDQSFETAVEWFTISANYYVPAQYRLAVMYKEGDGIDQDFKQAVYWFEKVEESVEKVKKDINRSNPILADRGRRYNHDMSLEDLLHTYSSYEKSAQYELASMNKNSGELDQSFEEAYQWHRIGGAVGEKWPFNRERYEWFKRLVEQG